ncbi:hypothetical protein [Streptomyces hokutonensis]|uniref:hypothetical protein n=1 Tax=Streptomyces hokutonensis TaxID=1306990 RepID=UPI0036B0D804
MNGRAGARRSSHGRALPVSGRAAGRTPARGPGGTAVHHVPPPPVDRRSVLHAALGTAAVAIIGGALTGDASRQRPEPSGVLRFATREPTAFYEAFGRLFAVELQAACPRLSCRARTTAGSVTDTELFRDHRADLALVLTDTARAA